MFDMQNVGRKISSLRKEKNMTQMELADKMGISFQSVSNWERGNTMPDISKLPELAELFGVTVDELLGKESKLINSVIEGRPVEYVEENDISVSELAEAAPVLKPDTVNEIVKNTDVLRLDKLSELSGETKRLDRLTEVIDTPESDAPEDTASLEVELKEYFAEITPLMPFLDDETLGKIAVSAEAVRACGSINPLLPFISSDVIDQLAQQRVSRGEGINEFLPFMSNDKIDKLAGVKIDHGEGINEFLPFMSRDKIDGLAGEKIARGEGINEFLPFMSNDRIDELAYDIYKKSGVDAIKSYAPFMSGDMLNRIAKEALEKGGFKSISGIAPFLG